MNRIAKRTGMTLLLGLLLVGGLLFFLVEYALSAEQWVVFPGSPHVYRGGNLDTGIVTDRNGTLLLDSTQGRVYNEKENIRKSTLHLLGDRKGYIDAPALSTYSGEMIGFDHVNGIYSAQGSGGKAVLTISAQAQTAALKALGDKRGTVGVYNYLTGEILCSVTSPTYDPDNVPDIAGDTEGIYEGVYINRFTQATYPPGSIFKVATAAAALSEFPDALERTYYCGGSFTIEGDQVICNGEHGEITLARALRQSCNCAFAQISLELGPDTLEKYIREFSVTDTFSYDGITTARGQYEIDGASAFDFAWSGIGQHTNLINPCRYMLFMGQIAGGGKAALPYLVSSAHSGSGNGYEAKTELSPRVMSTAVAVHLQEMMRQAVLKVYGEEHFPDIQVCGKSGTAQVGGGKAATATFAGFSLDREYPLAFVVVIEEGGSGSEACVPLLSKVLPICMEAVRGNR